MKKLLLLVAPVVLSASLYAGSMTGWISDAACSSGNAGSEQAKRDCAKRCLDAGEAAVFVDDKDQKVYKLANAPKAKTMLEKKVVISGDIKGDLIQVSSIEYAK